MKIRLLKYVLTAVLIALGIYLAADYLGVEINLPWIILVSLALPIALALNRRNRPSKPRQLPADYMREGILRCGSCTRGGSDNENKVVYANSADARSAASHYHRRFGGTLQEPYLADCERWHLYTPNR